MNSEAVYTIGMTDRGGWHRAIEIARALWQAGIWDGQRRIEINDPYQTHSRVFGIERLGVGQLVAGADYIIR